MAIGTRAIGKGLEQRIARNFNRRAPRDDDIGLAVLGADLAVAIENESQRRGEFFRAIVHDMQSRVSSRS